MISLIKKSLQIELHSFLREISKSHTSISNSAFNQARMKIKPELFKHFISFLNKEFYSENDERVKLWKGYRLLGCDGSTLTLPITKELKKKYSHYVNGHTTDVLIARTSILYDLENEMVLDGKLAPFSEGERQLAISLFQGLKKSQFKELIILDRGYPSYEMIYEMEQLNLDYLMRIKPSFGKLTVEFMNSDLIELITEIKPVIPHRKVNLIKKLFFKNKAIKIRLIKVLLESGEVEMLVTSLLNQKKYPLGEFKDLYFKRWGIETLYDKLKNKLLIEQFTGYAEASILQDFYCTLFLSNIQSLLTSEANDELKMNNINDTKYEYKINTNLSIGFIKTRLIELFSEQNHTENTLMELEALFIKNLIPIRPNRTFKRNTLKYRKRKKPPVTKNFKQAF